MYKPSLEQQNIKKVYTSTYDNIKIQAGAGTGKSYMASVLINSEPDLILYLTLNKDNKENMYNKMRTINNNVHKPDFKTFDQFILNLMMKHIGRKINPFKNMSKKDIIIAVDPELYNKWSNVISNTIDNFVVSSDYTIQSKHISKKDFSEIENYLRNKYRNKLNYEQEYKNYMNKLKNLMNHVFDVCNPIKNKTIDKCKFNNMCKYLDLHYKEQELAIEHHIIIVDEAQDITLCFGNILNKLNKRLILIGDQNQTINQFRGSDGIYFKECRFKTYPLTQSFRSNRLICDLANRVLSLSTQISLKSIKNRPEKEELAILCKTNKEILRIAEILLKYNIDFKADININLYIYMSYQIENLKNNKKTQNDELLENNIHNISDLEQKLEKINPTWNTVYKLIKEEGIYEFRDRICKLKNKLTNNENSKIIIKTIHRSKGEEYDYILLAPDCNNIINNINKRIKLEENINLLYVAITRGRIGCDTQFLSSIKILEKVIDLRTNFKYWNVNEELFHINFLNTKKIYFRQAGRQAGRQKYLYETC